MTNFIMTDELLWACSQFWSIPARRNLFYGKRIYRLLLKYRCFIPLEVHRILFVIKINFIKRQRTFNLRRCQHTWIIQIPNNPCLWSLCNICWLNQKGRTRSIEGNFYNSCQRAFWMESKKKDNYEWLEVCYIISLKFINIDLNCNS